jgi:acyl carrier protein
MNNGSSDGYIADVVLRNTSEALLKPIDKVVPEARLLTDLGAESIDIVDIRFRLEQEFGFKIDQDTMISSLGAGLTAKEFSDRLTVQFVIDYVTARLREREMAK